MRKIPALFILVFLGFLTGTAQIKLGILGGIHSSKVLETNSIPGWDTATKKYLGSKSGIQLGVIVEIPIGHKGFFFQPAVTYTSKGRKYAKDNDSATRVITDTVYARQKLNLGYIEVPLNVTYKLPLSANHKNIFFISAGPTISFYYSGSLTNESLSNTSHKYTNESDDLLVGKGANTYKTIDMGLNARAGFELGNVLLSGYFSQGLTSFYHATYQGTFHHQLMGASLGIWLTSTAAPVSPRKADTDKDGLPDEQDACPLQPGTSAWNGCPVPDTDHDGIDDDHDSCRTVPGLARYNGCPIPDVDGDGVNDEEDNCPDQIGLARYHGCPIPDRDGDGVNDEEDQCPDTTGTTENHGCPVSKPEIKEEVAEKINYIAKNVLFTSASDQLTTSSYLALDELASLLRIHPEWHLTINGYTDNQGNPERNFLLSQKRARSVKNYLAKKGIAVAQITANGLGMKYPIADNATPAGRRANRRVELQISPGK